MNLSHLLLEVRFPQIWNMIHHLRLSIKELFMMLDEENRYALSMAASELSENMVKYGNAVPGAETATIKASLEGDRLAITSRNGIYAEQNVNNVIEVIEALKAAENPEALYFERMRAMLENGQISSTQLGLIRIVSEGGFNLEYTFENQILTITAQKRISL